MSRQTIDKLLAEIKQLKAMNNRQAEKITELHNKHEKQIRANRALEAREQDLLARVAKQGKMPAQHGPEWRKTALEQE